MQWTPQAFAQDATPVQIDESRANDKVVILLEAKSSFGDPIYSYVQLTLKNLQKLRKSLLSREPFMPSDFGDVLAAGRGSPPDDLRQEMAVQYNMIDVPKRKVAAPPAFSAPKLWDDEY